MQSGISASEELQQAFVSLISSSTTPPARALLATISAAPERLIPVETILSRHASFTEDLSILAPHLKDNVASYLLIREEDNLGSGKPSGNRCAAVTYVPNAAPVRSKMLFASSRLTLVRELGTEHISQTLFVTHPSELTAQGWVEHLAHGSLNAPLTEEERNLEGIREAEAQESTGTGTSARRGGHVVQGGVAMPISDDAVGALVDLRNGDGGLVQLAIDRPTETITLVSSTSNITLTPSTLHTQLSTTSPRYSFYKPTSTSQSSSPPGIIFIYTCPPASSVKDRMVHAASVRSVVALAAKKACIEVARKVEAGDPSEVDEDALGLSGDAATVQASAEGDGAGNAGAGAGASNAGFARPKRPGRR